MSDGDVQGWHFDMTDFVVTIPVRAPSAGGEFEMYFIDRDNVGRDLDLLDLLRGRASPGVSRLKLSVGSLVLFSGRQTLHRVSPVRGETPRDVLLFGFDASPGADSTTENKLRRYGRATPAASG
jgi:hypothetical protein